MNIILKRIIYILTLQMDNQYEILELDELDLESDGQNILQKLQ